MAFTCDPSLINKVREWLNSKPKGNKEIKLIFYSSWNFMYDISKNEPRACLLLISHGYKVHCISAKGS